MKSMVLLLLVAAGVLVACAPAPVTGKTDHGKRKAEAAAPIGNTVEPVSIATWGPQTTTPGVPVNPLPNGDSGLYFVLSRPITTSVVQVFFEGRPLEGAATNGKVITAALPPREITAPGAYRIILKLGPGQFVEVGDFTVAARTNSAGNVNHRASSSDTEH